MSYQEFDALPQFEHAVFENGKRLASVTGNPFWSRPEQPPEVGDIVEVRINSIGLARVIGYFVQDGYLGLLVKPFDPPDWYIRQNGYFATGHVFGAEITTGDHFSEPVLKGPNQEQLAAVQRFATAHGRSWKSELSPVDLHMETARGPHRFALGRRGWRVQAGRKNLSHGGLSVLETAVPFIELSKPAGA